ncbi:transporter [Polaromonas sp.]|nr:transporter [Candidatus Saccharibacteria bacterium]
MSQFNIERSLQTSADKVFAFLPALLGAILFLVIGYFVAKTIQKVVQKALGKARFDRALHTSPAGKLLDRLFESPTAVVGKLVFYTIFLLFISFAVSALNIPTLNAIMTGIFTYIPKIIASVIIFLVASAITGGAEVFIRRVLGKSPMAKIVGAVLPVITMSIAIFMILNQLEIAPAIVNITYTAILGAMSLGLALAFGLGGRDVASQILSQAYESAQANAPMVKDEARRAKENTTKLAQQARDKAQQ